MTVAWSEVFQCSCAITNPKNRSLCSVVHQLNLIYCCPMVSAPRPTIHRNTGLSVSEEAYCCNFGSILLQHLWVCTPFISRCTQWWCLYSYASVVFLIQCAGPSQQVWAAFGCCLFINVTMQQSCLSSSTLSPLCKPASFAFWGLVKNASIKIKQMS